MTHADRFSADAPAGFEGDVAGLELPALIQLNVSNRFSGCLRVSREGDSGLVFFRDGDIVHAELGARAGEEAFCEMLSWPRGRFSVEPNVVTARRTIYKTAEHLLLDAHRLYDERRRAAAPPAAAAALAAAMPSPTPALTPPPSPTAPPARLDAVRSVAGVADAVLLTKDGAQVGGEGYRAEVLAGQTSYVVALAAELAGLLGAGDVRSASVQGARQGLLVLAAKAHHLGVLLDAGADVGAADAAIRAALAPKR
jgi:predicted regulator of Ras-like GTPase activity (Roadblock/LC7/MglB family)